MQNEQSLFDRCAICSGDAFWKRHWEKHLLCVNWSSCAGSGLSWPRAASSSVVTCRNFVYPSPDSALCDTHPPASCWPCLPPTFFCLFSSQHLQFLATAMPTSRAALAACYLHRSIPIFASTSVSRSWTLCQSFRNVPTLECTPLSCKCPECPQSGMLTGTSVLEKFICNGLISRGEKIGRRSWQWRAAGRRVW